MANITIFPSKWLYTSEGFDRVVDMPKCRGTDIIHVRNAHTMAPKISASVIAALFSLPTDGRAMVIADHSYPATISIPPVLTFEFYLKVPWAVPQENEPAPDF